MSERVWRFVQGSYLLTAMAIESDLAVMVFLGVTLFEGLTNLRIPKLYNKFVKGVSTSQQAGINQHARIPFEAEQLMRLTAFTLMYFSYFQFPEITWFFPWFFGVMLVLAGISKVCPMVLMFRFVGFR